MQTKPSPREERSVKASLFITAIIIIILPNTSLFRPFVFPIENVVWLH